MVAGNPNPRFSYLSRSNLNLGLIFLAAAFYNIDIDFLLSSAFVSKMFGMKLIMQITFPEHSVSYLSYL